MISEIIAFRITKAKAKVKFGVKYLYGRECKRSSVWLKIVLHVWVGVALLGTILFHGSQLSVLMHAGAHDSRCLLWLLPLDSRHPVLRAPEWEPLLLHSVLHQWHALLQGWTAWVAGSCQQKCKHCWKQTLLGWPACGMKLPRQLLSFKKWNVVRKLSVLKTPAILKTRKGCKLFLNSTP